MEGISGRIVRFQGRLYSEIGVGRLLEEVQLAAVEVDGFDERAVGYDRFAAGTVARTAKQIPAAGLDVEVAGERGGRARRQPAAAKKRRHPVHRTAVRLENGPVTSVHGFPEDGVAGGDQALGAMSRGPRRQRRGRAADRKSVV